MPPLRLVNEYTYTDIDLAFLDCIRHKKSKHPCVQFAVNHQANLMELLDEVNSGTYRIGPSRAFVVTWPKTREVWAAQFRDRVVHHLVCRDIAPFYVARFLPTNCACIKGRGTLYASLCLEKSLRSATRGWSRPAWVLKMDIANFFVSIRRSLLWSILKRDLGETSLTARLMRQIVFHDPTRGAIVKPGTNFDLVPRHKSLWHAPKGYGLPIGDLTSQLCASGVFLNELDQFVKHVVRARHYVRYVDDAVIVSHDRDELDAALRQISPWLQDMLGLRLAQDKTRIVPANSGINFVGRIILPHRAYARDMTVGRAREAAARLRESPRDVRALASVNSYLGLLQHCTSFNLRRNLCESVALRGVIEHDAAYTKIFHVT